VYLGASESAACPSLPLSSTMYPLSSILYPLPCTPRSLAPPPRRPAVRRRSAAPFAATRGLITGFAMLKLFSSRSKQTHLREACNSICALRGSLGSPINREPFHYTERYVGTYVRTYVRIRTCTSGLFRCEREMERPRSAFCAEKCGCFSFLLSCRAIVNLGWIAEGN